MKLKVCLVGDEGVGKTSLVRRFVLSEFDDRYMRTVGTVVHKRVVFLQSGEGTTYAANLLVWDVLGNPEFAERYRDAYFRNVAGVLAVCDVTRPATLDGLGDWIDMVRGPTRDVPAIVLANKMDLRAHFRIAEDDLLAFCELYGTPYLETSAKTGQNVGTAFAKLAEMALHVTLAERRRTEAVSSDDVPPAAVRKA